MKRVRVTVQAPAPAADDEAMVTLEWEDVVQLEGALLPYGNERAQRDYGYTGNVRYRFFYKGSHEALVEGNRILHDGIGLPIVYVANYGKAMDVLLDTSGRSARSR